MTTIHVICALITLGCWVWAQRKEYIDRQKVHVSIGTVAVMVLLMLAGLYGLLLTVLSGMEGKWAFLEKDVFVFHRKKPDDAEA